MGPLQLIIDSLPSLLGLDWVSSLSLGVPGINTISDSETLTQEFADVFKGHLGKYKATPISFNLSPQVAPIQKKLHRVPFTLLAKVDVQLDKLIAQGILEPVNHARWETPIVTPVKLDVKLLHPRTKLNYTLSWDC